MSLTVVVNARFVGVAITLACMFVGSVCGYISRVSRLRSWLLIGVVGWASAGVYAQGNGSFVKDPVPYSSGSHSNSAAHFFASYHQSTQVRVLHLFSMRNDFFQDDVPGSFQGNFTVDQHLMKDERHIYNGLNNGSVKS